MPELPEVENIVRSLANVIVGKKIISFELRYNKLIEEGDLNVLINHTFKDVKRKAKYLIFVLDNDLIYISHLRMEGKWFVHNSDYIATKHDHLLLRLDDGILVYNDTRKFGRIQIKNTSNYLNTYPLVNLGEDANTLLEENYLEFANKIQKQNSSIKETLLNKHIIEGIGNIYADEILFIVKINPLTPTKYLTIEQIYEIFATSKKVLDQAIINGGSTIKSFKITEELTGHNQDFLQVYGRENQECLICGSHIIKVFHHGRGTHFCPKCQNNQKEIIGITGQIGTGKSTVSSYLAKKDYVVLDADKIVHKLMQKNKELYNKLIELFTETILDKEGFINKNFLRELLIEKNKKTNIYLNFVNETVSNTIIDEIFSSSATKFVLDVPLLFNTNLAYLCTSIIELQLPKEIQKARLLKRDNSLKNMELLGLRVENNNFHTFVISNTGNIHDLEKEVSNLLKIKN
jgi:formamidopyrimidine-DNA glycosylase